jgi:hypothetical protein
MKNEIIIGTERFAVKKLDVTQSYLDQSEVACERHKRGRNWVATVRFDPAAPNSLARDFWKRGSGSYVGVPPALAVGEVLEFGADYYTCAGHRHENRHYHRVLAVSPVEIVLRETKKPGKRSLRPVAQDIMAAEIGGDIRPAAGPLAEVSTADLVAELSRRGVCSDHPTMAKGNAAQSPEDYNSVGARSN